MQVTAAANMANPGTGSDATTSYQVLTVTSAGVPVWTNTIDGGTFSTELNMDVQIVIATLQRKVSELTLTNVMLEAQLQDLRSQLNSMKEQQSIENAIDGNENRLKRSTTAAAVPTTSNLEDGEVALNLA